jgi:protein O-mannosyl-transferase
MTDKKTAGLLCALLAAVSLAYGNHFQNAFHFDDAHTILDNPYIRSLANLPRFFADAQTFSTLPSNQSYRPLISASLAIDYWMGNGLNSFYFHLSTFFWFLLQLSLTYVLFRTLCDLARPDPRNRPVALFATALYGLHPAIAETVNYVIQRGDIYSTLGMIASLLIYAAAPRRRKWGLYLLPLAAALLCKPPALIFPVLLFTYVMLFEEQRPARALARCLPALLTTVAFGYLVSAMTPKAYNPGAFSAYAYRMTQPLVALRYFRTFFVPIYLSADTDHGPVHSLWNDGAWSGFVFVFGLILLAAWCSRRREWRPAAFGLWWFLLALLPTAIFPLSEVENDHRMYFPFVGVSLAVSWTAERWLYAKLPRRRSVTRALSSVCLCLLAIAAWGTWQRNAVWRTEESLWYDVTRKSPRNGRGLMNYGLTQLARGDAARALDYFQRATAYTPNYPFLEINLGIAHGAVKQDEAAERHFARAIELAPGETRSHYYYARWLKQKGRWQESIPRLHQAVALNPSYLDARYLLIQIFFEHADWTDLKAAAEDTLQHFPADTTASSYLSAIPTEADGLREAEQVERPSFPPDAYLALSFSYYQSGRYQDCIAAAQQVLRLRPNDATAYNNIAAAYEALQMWDPAIEAARAALKIRPGFELARNNLAWAEAQKRKTSSP